MKNDNYTETEVKILVDSLARIEKKLRQLQAILVKPRVFEVNIRYDDSKGSLGARGIVLRLRRDDDFRITYKDAGVMHNGIVSRFEAEVQVSDFETMDIILQRLGFVQSIIYEKYRTTYRFSETEIVLDELPYGHFVEIEGVAEQIELVIKALDLQQAARAEKSYVKLFSDLAFTLRLPFRDLTFENFKDIDVSLEELKRHLT